MSQKIQMLLQKQSTRPLPPNGVSQGVPSDLSELAMALLRIEPDRRAGAEEVAKLVGGEPQMSAPDIEARGREVFVGRDQELEALHEAFAEARNNEPVVVHIAGRSGMGKSALVGHFLHQIAAEGSVTLLGRCFTQAFAAAKSCNFFADPSRIASISVSSISSKLASDAFSFRSSAATSSMVCSSGISGSASLSLSSVIDLSEWLFLA